MRRCLIVANQTLTTDTLSAAVERQIAAEPHEFYVVAPATPLRDEIDAPAAYAELGPPPADRAYALARQRLDRALDHLRSLGATVDGEVGDPDPLEAVRVALGHFAADEILVSTLPRGLSQWLRRDLPARLRKGCGIPVTHLVAERDANARARPHPGCGAQPDRRSPASEPWPELRPRHPVRGPGQARTEPGPPAS